MLVGNFGCTAAHGGAAGLTTPQKVAMLSYVKQQRAWLCVMAARSCTFRVCTGRNLQLRPALPSVTAVGCAGDGVQRCQQQWALPCVWRHQQVKGCACWGGEDVELCPSAETQEDCVQPVSWPVTEFLLLHAVAGPGAHVLCRGDGISCSAMPGSVRLPAGWSKSRSWLRLL